MEGIDAYYQFQIDKINKDGTEYAINPLFKVGNDVVLNMLFENARRSKFRKVGPILDMSDYISYEVNLSANKGVPIIISFQLSTLSFPYGIMRCCEMKDAILFNITEEEVFEVFVFKGEYGNSLNYLQLLKNGDLNDMICEIKVLCCEKSIYKLI